jgi:nucleoside-diphosphate-sugar epimerase/choline dehydrogenase-like flavoprotein
MIIPKRPVKALIIGSGAGGATTALTLAEGGLETVVLEEGARFGPESYGLTAPEAMKSLYRKRGMTPILGSVPIGYVEGCCVGGSTEINSGFWHRIPREILLRWKAQYDLLDASSEALVPHFQWAEQLLGVTLHSGEWPVSTRAFARGIEAMGWAFDEVPRAAQDCKGLNLCASGCPTGAKRGMSVSLIPLAEALGARVVSQCRVELILKKSGTVHGVLATVCQPDGSQRLVRVDCESLFVCSGATETPALLRRSGIKYHIGDSLRIHPMLKVVARFPEDVDSAKSVLPLVQVKEFWPEVTLGGSYYSLGHLALVLRENWTENHVVMKDHRKTAVFYVAVKGTGIGRVRPCSTDWPGSVIRYELSREDVRNLSNGLARLSALLLAGGAQEVYPNVFGLPAIRTELEAIRWLDELLPKRNLSLGTVHAFSSCPAGERRESCAADSFGRVYGYDNLYINDASMLPDSPGVNPQGAIMALARRNALRFVERSRSTRPVGRSKRADVSVAGNSSLESEARSNDAASEPMTLVTGATGWLGYRLVKAIAEGLPDVPSLAAGSSHRLIRCLVRPGEDFAKLETVRGRVQFFMGDVTDPRSLDAFFRHAEGAVLYHCAGAIHPARRVKELFAVNVAGTANVVQKAQAAGVRRLIHVSSNSPFGCNPDPDHNFDEASPYNPYMNYGLSKKLAEDIVLEAMRKGVMEAVIIRPPWFYGPGQPPRQSLFFSMIKDGKVPLVGAGLNRRSMAYVDNICQAALLCERIDGAAGNVYWIADRRSYTMLEIIETVERVMERDFGLRAAHKAIRLPSFVSEVALVCDKIIQSAGLYNQKIHVLSEMNKTIACSIEKAQKELGYDPKIELEEGMRRSIQWMLDSDISL